jgi:thiol-disulfide isomerase/thioredoxin
MFALGSAASAQYPRWLHGATGFARAVELQRELNISLVLYFYKDRCSDCRTLEEQYLADQFVHRALQRSIAVRINPDYGVEEHRIAERYGVVSYPAFLILDNESAPARNVQPFRRDGNHLTPEQFARACEKLMTWLPMAPKVAPDPSRESHDRANARAVMNATRQTRNPQIVELGAKPSASPVESKPTPLPTIDELLKTYVNAIGGREAHEKLKSRVIKGRIDLAGAESWGQLEIYGKAPNKSLTVMNVQPMGQVKHGYDGCTAWNAGDTVGLKTLTGPALAHFATNSDFYRELKLKDLYPGLRLMGRMKEKDREFFLVEGFPVTGGAEIMYFDSKTGFLTGRDVTQQTPQGPIRVEMRYGDWRDVDGVKLPFKIIQIMPNLRYVFTVREVKHNQPVDDKLFEKP